MPTARSFMLALLGGAGLIAQLPSAEAGTLSNVGFTLSDYSAGAHADVTVSFTIQTPLDGGQDEDLFVTLPLGFALVNGTFGSFCADNITISINNVVQGTGPSGVDCGTFGFADFQAFVHVPVASGSTIAITFSHAIETNPATAGPYQMIVLRTADFQGISLDTPAVLPSVTILPPPPVPTLSSWALLALAGLIGGTGWFAARRRFA